MKENKVSCINGSLFKRFNGISITCKDNVSVIKTSMMLFFYYECWQRITGFLQIGKNGSGRPYIIDCISKSRRLPFSYCRHLI